MVAQMDNGCRQCPKVFCCSDCRDVHESKKHPKPKCSLCLNQNLPFKPKHEETPEESQLLCHVVYNHLPVSCKLCGEIYRSSRDLALAKDCSWWSKQTAQPPPQIKIAEDQLPHTPTLPSAYHQQPSTSSNLVNPLKRHRQQHQQQQQQQLQDSGNFDSPPAVGTSELVRHTSTPVQGSTSSSSVLQRQSSAPSCLNSTSSPQLASGCSTGVSLKRSAAALQHQLQPRLSLSPASALNSCCVDRANDSEQSSWPHSILKGSSTMRSSSANNDSASKRVRFNDKDNSNFNDEPTSNTESADTQPNTANNSLNEVYYEARTSQDEPDSSFDVVIHNPDSPTDTENEKQRGGEEVDSQMQVVDQDKREIDEERKEDCQSEKLDEKKLRDSEDLGFGSFGRSSSRLVMMLVVEKTDSDQSLGSLDLEPLINSGLKKLEEDIATTSAVARSHDRETEVGSKKLPDGSGNEDERRCVRSSTVTTSLTRAEIHCVRGRSGSHVADAAAVGAGVVVKADGLLSMVARIFRCALNKLQPAMVASAMASAAAASSTSSCTLAGVHRAAIEPVRSGSRVKASSSSSISIATASTVILQQQKQRSNSFKRPRADSSEEHVSSPSKRNSPGADSTGSRNEVVLSPVAKRPRGYYRIKAREPIARMRRQQQQQQQQQKQTNSPMKGSSLGTQRFQLGELTYGDTRLPLPSRAHQSTQTDD